MPSWPISPRCEGSDLLPDDNRQIEMMRWLSWSSQHFTRHAGTLYFQYHHQAELCLERAHGPQGGRGGDRLLQAVRPVLNDHLRGRKYLLGDTLTIADFAVGVTLPYAEKIKLPLGSFPEIERWHARLNELPAWREPFPDAKAAAA